MRLRHTPLLLVLLILSSCFRSDEYNKQGDVNDIVDAMEHCHGLMETLVPSDAVIYYDDKSTRETVEYYDVYFDLQDATQEGWAQCRVNKRGLITLHTIYDFRQKSRSFSD